MSTQTSPSIPARISPRPIAPSRAAPQGTAGIAEDAGHILAQVPDLEPEGGVKLKDKRGDGRIISQAMSMKLVFGVGAGLLIGAILPFLFSRGNRSQPVKELPAWNSHGAQSAAAPDTAQTSAPVWTGANSGQRTVVVPPQATTAGMSPPPPQAGDYHPAAMNGPAWSRPQNSPSAPQQAANFDQNYAPRNAPTGRPGDPRALQADNRNDPRYGYNTIDAPPPGAARDNRYDNPNYPNGAVQGNPLMPAAGQGAGGSHRDQPQSEPGVARFDGTITNPPDRTN